MAATMRIHPKALLVAAAFGVLILLAVDVRLGVAAIVAGTVIDGVFFVVPLCFGGSRDRRHTELGSEKRTV
jgi:hypothetical protein